MKHINILNFLNRFIMILTVGLYATFYLGLLAQVVLGVYQLLVALSLLLFLKSYEKKQRKMLITYWGITLFYGVFALLGIMPANDILKLFFWIVIPMSIAGYFTYLLETIKTSYGNIK